jgi:hypothetical protein
MDGWMDRQSNLLPGFQQRAVPDFENINSWANCSPTGAEKASE